jgi:uncharacterized protein (TIGR00266 family)
MQIDIQHGPGNAAAHCVLSPDDSLTAEGGSMISMSGDMDISTTTKSRGKGGVGKAVKRMFSGENFFLNHYTPGPDGGEVWLATTLPGDMMVYEMDEEKLVVQGGSFVACEEGIEVSTGWQGFKSFLSGENMFWVTLEGSGKAVLNSFGAIYPIQVSGAHIVDTGHIVAFNESLDFKVTKAGKSWLSSILGGEALVCRFEGEGTVWCQSHNESPFGRSLGPLLKPR